MKISRRNAIAAGAVASAGVQLQARLSAADAVSGMNGKINHSVCKWCYPKVELEALCRDAKSIGLTSIELLGPNEWPVLQRYGITCAMTGNPTKDGLGGITKAFNRLEHHDKLGKDKHLFVL